MAIKEIRQKKSEENTHTSIAVNIPHTMRNNPIAFDSSCGSEYAAMTPDAGMRMAEQDIQKQPKEAKAKSQRVRNNQ